MNNFAESLSLFIEKQKEEGISFDSIKDWKKIERLFTNEYKKYFIFKLNLDIIIIQAFWLSKLSNFYYKYVKCETQVICYGLINKKCLAQIKLEEFINFLILN